MPKTKRKGAPVEMGTPDFLAERREELRRLVPDAFTESGIDPQKLAAAVGESLDEGTERYSFTWAGKRDAIRLLQVPSRGTLIPAPEESVNFDTTQNIFIEGENLEVLKLLYKSYAGRVKLIYIDPPYNTGGDFIYPDNFADPLETYLRLTGQKDISGNLLTSNTETNGRFHSTWLSLMWPRIFVARQLLRNDGIIFVSIDDSEVHNLRLLMNEVFGEENIIAQITWKNVYGGGAKSKHVVTQHEYILVYARSKEQFGTLLLPPDPKARERYTERDDKYKTRGPYFTQPLATTSMDFRPNLRFAISWKGHEIWPEKQWQWSKERVLKALTDDELVIRRDGEQWSVRYKQYLYDEIGEERGSKLYSVLNGPWSQEGTAEITELFEDGKVFPFPKPSALIRHLSSVVWLEREPSIILDFFAGSCPTAQAIFNLNRELGANHRFILVQIQEEVGLDSPAYRAGFKTIADVGKERVRRVIKEMKKEKQAKLRNGQEDLGFRVFKLSESHLRRWKGVGTNDPEALTKEMALFTELLLPGWKTFDVIHEVILAEGFSLTCKIEEVPAKAGKKNTVYRVTDPDKEQSFFICLDDKLHAETSKSLKFEKETIFICRDSALTDELAANLALQCKLKTI